MVEKGEEVFNYDNQRDYLYLKQLKVFINSVEKNISPPVNINNGIDVIRLIDSVRKASLIESKVLL